VRRPTAACSVHGGCSGSTLRYSFLLLLLLAALFGMHGLSAEHNSMQMKMAPAFGVATAVTPIGITEGRAAPLHDTADAHCLTQPVCMAARAVRLPMSAACLAVLSASPLLLLISAAACRRPLAMWQRHTHSSPLRGGHASPAAWWAPSLTVLGISLT